MAKASYDAKDIHILEGLEAVRKRPGMYIGGTGSPGLQHCVWEIVDNSVDEALAGHATRIHVTLHPDGSVEVSDDGRGIPVDKVAKARMSGVEAVMTKLHAGGKFGGGGYSSAGGLHGVGASVVNALSARMDVTVRRDGKIHEVSFRQGVAGEYTGKTPDSTFTPKSGLRVTGKCAPKTTGTTVRFWPDRTIFTPEATLDAAQVFARARQTAFLVPGLTLMVEDRTGSTPVEETFRFAGGIADMVGFLNSGTPVADTHHFTTQATFSEVVPMLDSTGHMKSTEVQRTVNIDIAFAWNAGYDSALQSFVNVVATPKGGTHVKGFERGLVNALRKGYEGTRILKANEDPIAFEDAAEGLVAVVSVGFPEPQFEGQTKEILGTPAITKLVQDATVKGVTSWMTGRKKAQARAVLEKAANASRARVAARTQREAARRKTAIEGASMPAKLVDCRSTGVSSSELFIVEGDSALGSARLARNSELQALLPIRGKILNVQKANLSQMLNNTECASIIQVIGAGSGRTFNLDDARYGRVILMTDADVDGSHIRVLLLTLFHKYLPGLIEDGRLFAAVPPLFKVTTSGKGAVSRYVYTAQQLPRVIAELEAAGHTVKTPITRFKGLGEMDADELWETTMDPAVRTVRQITLADTARASEALELLMGDEVAPRRSWLIENADRVTELDD